MSHAAAVDDYDDQDVSLALALEESFTNMADEHIGLADGGDPELAYAGHESAQDPASCAQGSRKFEEQTADCSDLGMSLAVAASINENTIATARLRLARQTLRAVLQVHFPFAW